MAKISGLIVPPVRDMMINKHHILFINADTRKLCCKISYGKGFCPKDAICNKCVFCVDHHKTFMMMAHNHWERYSE